MAQLTQAQLQLMLANVRAVGLDYEAMAEALDLAMFMAANEGTTDVTLPVASISSDGTAINTIDMGQAIKLAQYFRQRACGGHISQPLEFNRY